MTALPKLSINRYQPGLYGWEFTLGDARTREVGVGGVFQCLQRALCAIPDNVAGIELQYCAMHAGVITRADMLQRGEEIAKDMVMRHAIIAMK